MVSPVVAMQIAILATGLIPKHLAYPGSSLRGFNTAGFTLIEMLVVVVIIALLAGAAIISADFDNADARVEREIDRLSALLDLQCEEAILLRQQTGIHLSQTGYQFSILENQAGQPRIDRVFREREFAHGLEPQLKLDGRYAVLEDEFPEYPQLVCFSSGESTPFIFELTTEAQSRSVVLKSDGLGQTEQIIDGHNG